MTWMNGIRVLGALILAIANAMALLIAVELYSSVVHPFPEGFGGSMDEMCQHVARYPHWVLATVVVMWGAIAFLSTWIAGRVGNRTCAIVIGTLLFAGMVMNVLMLPYPIWFKILMPIAIVAADILGLFTLPARKPIADSLAIFRLVRQP